MTRPDRPGFPGRLRAVIFDLDGTLVDTADEFIPAVQALRAEHGREAMDPVRIRASVSNGARALVSLGLELAESHPTFEAQRLRLLELYGEVLGSVAALAPREPRREAEPELMNVYILGEANEPGRKEVLPGTTLLQFLAEAGGLSRFAAEKRIQLRRVDPDSGQERVYPFNYRTMGGSDSISGTTVLAPGDVIFVPERRLFE